MPQKKNPDALELLRGKTGRTCGQVSLEFLYIPSDIALMTLCTAIALWILDHSQRSTSYV